MLPRRVDSLADALRREDGPAGPDADFLGGVEHSGGRRNNHSLPTAVAER
jgi:hypothetical protein